MLHHLPHSSDGRTPRSVRKIRHASHPITHPTTFGTTTLPHLFVAVPEPARRPVKGELCSAAKRRTLDGPSQAPVILAPQERSGPRRAVAQPGASPPPARPPKIRDPRPRRCACTAFRFP